MFDHLQSLFLNTGVWTKAKSASGELFPPPLVDILFINFNYSIHRHPCGQVEECDLVQSPSDVALHNTTKVSIDDNDLNHDLDITHLNNKYWKGA